MLEDTRARRDLHRRLASLGAVADGYRPDRFDSQTSMTTGMIMGRRR
jgi:hypothetical protein